MSCVIVFVFFHPFCVRHCLGGGGRGLVSHVGPAQPVIGGAQGEVGAGPGRLHGRGLVWKHPEKAGRVSQMRGWGGIEEDETTGALAMLTTNRFHRSSENKTMPQYKFTISHPLGYVWFLFLSCEEIVSTVLPLVQLWLGVQMIWKWGYNVVVPHHGSSGARSWNMWFGWGWWTAVLERLDLTSILWTNARDSCSECSLWTAVNFLINIGCVALTICV